MKKTLAILLALVMMLSMVAMAETAALDPTDADNATITISNASRGETYYVYKLFDATVTGTEDGSIAYTGEIPAALATYFEADTAGNISVKASVDQDALIAALKTWAGSATPTNSAVNNDGAAMVFTGLPYGYYVVTSTLNGGAAITVDSTNPSATINDKNTITPITPPGSDVDYKKVDDADVSVGDTVTYTVEFKTATYDGVDKITKYTITDTLPDFLSNVTVTEIKVGDETIATQQFDDNGTIEIAWVSESGNSLYSNGAILKVTYTAVVNEKVAIAGNGSTNDVDITYTTDKGTTSTPVEDSAVIKSYAIAIKKVNDKGVALAGATFQLPFYVKSTADTDGAYIYAGTAAGDGLTNTLTTPESGELIIKGVASGTYSITETVAPNGYNKLTAPVSVTAIQTNETQTNVTKYLDADGNVTETVTETSVTVVNDDIAASAVVVVNKTGSELPTTGGMGTTLFYVVGSLMMAAAVVVLVAKKKVSCK